MNRRFFAIVLLASGLTTSAEAQQWAEKMFAVRSHDFGTVARSAKTEFAFELTNRYVEEVHIASVRATCGCTSPRIVKDTLKTHEKGAIIAHINSGSFLGNQSATLTVTFDKPFYAQVQLTVKVYVFTDVLLQPASVEFGEVLKGNRREATVDVRYTGRSDWRVLEVVSDNPHLTGSVSESSRAKGRIEYQLKAVLSDNFPAGYLQDTLWLVTNDAQRKKIPIPVEGLVVEPIKISPKSLFMGIVRPGQQVTKVILMRGREPFLVKSVRGDCECLSVSAPKTDTLQSTYQIPVTFTARNDPGNVTQTIQIEVSGGQPPMSVPVFAKVGP